MDFEEDNLRGCSPKQEHNSPRNVFTKSYASSLSIEYAERMQIQSNNIKQAEQVEQEYQQNPDFPYAPQASDIEHSQPTHGNGIDSNTVSPPVLEPSIIPYQANQPIDPLLWDGNFSAISLFGTEEFLNSNTKNIAYSLQRMANFIKQRPIGDKTEKDIPQIDQFGYAAWEFILAIYKAGWDKIIANANGKSFRQCVSSQFNRNKVMVNKDNNGKLANISKVPPLIPPRPSASVLAKSKYHNKGKSFTQDTKNSVKDILKIKEAFPKLSLNKIIEIHRVANNKLTLNKRKVIMTTKGPSRKQVIVPMSKENTKMMMDKADLHVTNINRILKSIKLEIMADFIRANNKGIAITTNKIANPSDLKTIENYINNVNNINHKQTASA